MCGWIFYSDFFYKLISYLMSYLENSHFWEGQRFYWLANRFRKEEEEENICKRLLFFIAEGKTSCV